MTETLDTPDDTPSPFRRFPWVQLVFCVACLTMTAWTWMRYSYAWGVTEEGLWRLAELDKSRPFISPPPHEPYVHYHGTGPASFWSERLGDGSCRLRSPAGVVDWYKVVDERQEPLVAGSKGRVCLNRRMTRIVSRQFGPSGIRLVANTMVNTTASRFTGESIAGIFVGAMGCFIFGMYLRRWLRERRAA